MEPLSKRLFNLIGESLRVSVVIRSFPPQIGREKTVSLFTQKSIDVLTLQKLAFLWILCAAESL